MGMGMGMANMMMNQQDQNNQPTEKAQTKEEIMTMLKELGDLQKNGILTKKEFDEKKKELLARL
jgi:phage host-nuclease inhibitor protein Gam